MPVLGGGRYPHVSDCTRDRGRLQSCFLTRFKSITSIAFVTNQGTSDALHEAARSRKCVLEGGIELTRFASMVTSLMAEPASLAAARHAVARTAGAGGKPKGGEGDKDAFIFTSSFWEVIRCCGILQELGRQRNPSSDGSCSVAVPHFSGVVFSLCFQRRFLPG